MDRPRLSSPKFLRRSQHIPGENRESTSDNTRKIDQENHEKPLFKTLARGPAT
jgi:hypothetical protein